MSRFRVTKTEWVNRYDDLDIHYEWAPWPFRRLKPYVARGNGTVWREYPSGVRYPTSWEGRFAAIWTKARWEKEEGVR